MWNSLSRSFQQALGASTPTAPSSPSIFISHRVSRVSHQCSGSTFWVARSAISFLCSLFMLTLVLDLLCVAITKGSTLLSCIHLLRSSSCILSQEFPTSVLDLLYGWLKVQFLSFCSLFMLTLVLELLYVVTSLHWRSQPVSAICFFFPLLHTLLPLNSLYVQLSLLLISIV